jgi:CCCH zinc finger in TRM13 protein
MRPEHADVILVAEWFAEHLAEGDWDGAFQDAQAAYEVSHGAYLLADRDDGGCRAVTRDARYCPFPARPGETYCGLHARYIHQREDA